MRICGTCCGPGRVIWASYLHMNSAGDTQRARRIFLQTKRRRGQGAKDPAGFSVYSIHVRELRVLTSNVLISMKNHLKYFVQ